MATQKPIDPQDLRRDFNVVNVELDPQIEYGKHFRHANYWTERILKMCFFLNIGSILFLTVGVIAFLLKPQPATYATTELGSLYRLEGVSESTAKERIKSHQATKLQNQENNPNQNGQNGTLPTAPHSAVGEITAEKIIENSNGTVNTVPLMMDNVGKPPEKITTIQAPLSDLTQPQAPATLPAATLPNLDQQKVPAPSAGATNTSTP